jgi:hypothetical protein
LLRAPRELIASPASICASCAALGSQKSTTRLARLVESLSKRPVSSLNTTIG